MKKFWCCYVEGTGGFRHQHPDMDGAAKEAERLAAQPQNYGKKVYVLETVGCCAAVHPPVTWLNIDYRCLPR